MNLQYSGPGEIVDVELSTNGSQMVYLLSSGDIVISSYSNTTNTTTNSTTNSSTGNETNIGENSTLSEGKCLKYFKEICVDYCLEGCAICDQEKNCLVCS